EKRCEEALSRRDFIKHGSSMIAGAAGLTSFGAPAVLSAQNVNSRISLGFLGTGSRGCEIMRSIAGHDEFLVTDICDIYPPHLEEGRKYAGNDKVRAWKQWEKVLEQKDVDAVVVATPLFLHVPMSIASLEAGKHVLSEKSMGLTMKQLNQMLANVKKHKDKVYLVGYQSRLDDCLIEAKRLVEAGSIGQVTQFYVHFDRNETWKREGIDPEWERVLNWRLYKEYCGGLLTEVITHEIDQVIDILGTMPVNASFSGRIQVYKDGREHHDSIMGTFEMEDGVIGVGTGHLSNASQRVGWTLLGTHGTIEAYGGELRLYWEKQARHLDSFGVRHKFTNIKLGQSLETPESRKHTPAKVIKFDIDSDYDLGTAREYMHFYDCILNGARPVMDAESSRLSSIAALMAYHSSMNGGRRVTRREVEDMG
ncbi:MAG: Gfo/Idh/MocA family oxidoreductase, partial [Gemmatimonadota bacterium]|nr:Gfo/Idh/MocA family oxidoreductase [Gemmatimonadota bacterium]